MCELCHTRGWFFYLHWETKIYEIRHCDQCQVYSDHQAAGVAAVDAIAKCMRTAEVMTETRATDEWAMDTVPCSICFKKGWHIKANANGIMQLLHCDHCMIYASPAEAAEVALKQIAEAFELVNFTEELRENDPHIKDQTAKAFGEVKHQWMVKNRRRENVGA